MWWSGGFLPRLKFMQLYQNGTNQGAGLVIKANHDQYDGSGSEQEGRFQRDSEE